MTERQFLGKIEVEPLYERAKDHELPMEPHGGAADAAEQPPPFAHLVGEDLLLDAVELGSGVVGIAIDGVDHLLQEHLQKYRRGWNFATASDELARDVDRAQRAAAAGDEQRLGQGEMEKADLFSQPVEIADEVGQNAVETAAARVELLMLIGGDEELPRYGG